MGEKGINGTRGEMGQKGEMVSWDQTCNVCIKIEQKICSVALFRV